MITQSLAFILHIRPYRDKKLLVDFISAEQGRFTGVCNRRKGEMLQPFIPYSIHWKGQGPLKTITLAQIQGPAYHLHGTQIYMGLYINELLQRLLVPECAIDDLYQEYATTLAYLAHKSDPEPALRRFELLLLSTLGYGIDFSVCAHSQQPIRAENHYYFVPRAGFVQTQHEDFSPDVIACTGAHIQAIAQFCFDSPYVRMIAKRVCRSALAVHLGAKPLQTREGLVALHRSKR